MAQRWLKPKPVTKPLTTPPVPFVPFNQSDMCYIKPCVNLDQAIFDRQHAFFGAGGRLIFDDANRANFDRFVAIVGRSNGEIFGFQRSTEIDCVFGEVGVAVGGQVNFDLAFFGNDFTCRDDHFDGQLDQITADDDVGVAAGSDGANVFFDTKMFGGVERGHLNSCDGFETLGNGVAHHAVHVSVVDERAGVAVVGAEDEVAAVQSLFSDGFDLCGNVIPGGAEAQHRFHALAHAGDGVCGASAFVVVGWATSDVAVEW